MAQKNKTDLLAEIAGLTPLVPLEDVQAILTDMVDSFTSGIVLIPYDTEVAIAEGLITVTHNLGITVYDVWVYDTDNLLRYKPDYTTTDENEIVISWVGDSISNSEIYFLAKQV
jgi:hypothetical protein